MFCGTKGYVTPKVIIAYKKAKELKKQRDKGIEIVIDN
jgi:hypothetical protein